MRRCDPTRRRTKRCQRRKSQPGGGGGGRGGWGGGARRVGESVCKESCKSVLFASLVLYMIFASS